MYPNPRKTTSIRRLGTVDIAALKPAVAAIPEDIWNLENKDKPNRFEALDTTRHIVFRFVSDFKDWRTSYDRPLWMEWQSLLTPVLEAATADYGYAQGIYPRVMLARMAADGVIQPHRDANPAAKWPHKIHVPIETNDQVVFLCRWQGLPDGRRRGGRTQQHGGACCRESWTERPYSSDFRIL